MKTKGKTEIEILKSKLAILNRHFKKRPITKSHADFLERRIVETVAELSKLEQYQL
jgi:hypothetical protein